MPSRAAHNSITLARIARLYRLTRLLGGGPKTRAFVTRKLQIDTRGFYRDIQQLKTFGVPIEVQDRRYQLREDVDAALGRLPFPDPRLSVQEVLQLARGRSAAHKKLRDLIDRLLDGA